MSQLFADPHISTPFDFRAPKRQAGFRACSDQVSERAARPNGYSHDARLELIPGTRAKSITVYDCSEDSPSCGTRKESLRAQYDQSGRAIRFNDRALESSVSIDYVGASREPFRVTEDSGFMGKKVTEFRSTPDSITEIHLSSDRGRERHWISKDEITTSGDTVVMTSTAVGSDGSAETFVRTFSGGLLRSAQLPSNSISVDPNTHAVLGSEHVVDLYTCSYENLSNGGYQVAEYLTNPDGKRSLEAQSQFDKLDRPVRDWEAPLWSGRQPSVTEYQYGNFDQRGNWKARHECRAETGKCSTVVRDISY